MSTFHVLYYQYTKFLCLIDKPNKTILDNDNKPEPKQRNIWLNVPIVHTSWLKLETR